MSEQIRRVSLSEIGGYRPMRVGVRMFPQKTVSPARAHGTILNEQVFLCFCVCLGVGVR